MNARLPYILSLGQLTTDQNALGTHKRRAVHHETLPFLHERSGTATSFDIDFDIDRNVKQKKIKRSRDVTPKMRRRSIVLVTGYPNPYFQR